MKNKTLKTLFKAGFIFLLAFVLPYGAWSQQYSYPVHVSVQVQPPHGLYLSDYTGGSRDRLVVTLLNRDMEKPALQVKLRVEVKNGSSFSIRSREELNYPPITLESGIPTRLTSGDLAPYFSAERMTMSGSLKDGQLPTGMTEFRVQVVDHITGRVLSEYGTGRAWLESKQPPMLNLPANGPVISLPEPQHLRFQWMPRHQGLASTVYEFVLKELPKNGAPAQSAFQYGNEIYRTETRTTTLNYSHLEPTLMKAGRYAWQVRAKAMDGVDEIGMFENNGYSEIWEFTVSDNCAPPVSVNASVEYRKMTLQWGTLADHTSYVVEYRPKSSHGTYDWISTRTFDVAFTAYDLAPGWTYEYRVGALCLMDTPVFSPVGEITIPLYNEERMEQCGVFPAVELANQDPLENLRAGDVVTVGGDFPMTITTVSPQGNGWYSGKGRLLLPWIFETEIAVQFNRIRVNTDYRQIGGEVETGFDPNASQIADLNELDYGGRQSSEATVVFDTKEFVKVDFEMPEVPKGNYDLDKGELTVYDVNNAPHVVPVPKDNTGKSIFPMIVEDSEGSRYQIDLPEGTEVPAGEAEQAPGTEGDGTETVAGSTEQPARGTTPVVITRIEDVAGQFDMEKLTAKADVRVTFSRGTGQYAFDAGAEPWYQYSTMLRREHYEPFGEGYIAPWKLIPVGENDTVEATVSGDNVDPSKVRFVLKDGTGIPAREENGKWTLTLPSVASGEHYPVFALYEKRRNEIQTVGKLNVISYPKQTRTVTLVSVMHKVDQAGAKAVEDRLNAIYNPYGVTFTVETDQTSIDGVFDWDQDGDSRLNLNGSGFFSNETAEMKALRQAFQQSGGYTRDGYYIFLLDEALADQEPDAPYAAAGDMPRGKQFGYIFMQHAGNLPRTIAHELGHGIFTLQHSFDNNYSGPDYKGQTPNLMDYANGTELGVWQWKVMANPAPLTWFDTDEDGMVIDFRRARDEVENLIKTKLEKIAVSSGDQLLFAIISMLYVTNYVDWTYSNWGVDDVKDFLKAYRALFDSDEIISEMLQILNKHCNNRDIADLMNVTNMSRLYALEPGDIATVESITQRLIRANADDLSVIMGLLFEFKYGVGPETREFGENSVLTRGIKDFYLVEEGRKEFYTLPERKACIDNLPALYGLPVEIEDPVTARGAYIGVFGLKGVPQAGFDLVGQYVGGFYMEMIPSIDGKTMEMILYNKLNLESLVFHYFYLNDIVGKEIFPKAHPRRGGVITPLGEVLQIMRWTESIDINRLK